jgi:hypothetical protein
MRMVIRVAPCHASPLAFLSSLLLSVLVFSSCQKAGAAKKGEAAKPSEHAANTVDAPPAVSPEDAKKLSRMRYELEAAQARIAGIKKDIETYRIPADTDFSSEDLKASLDRARSKKAYLEHNLAKIEKEIRKYEKGLATDKE